MQKLAEAATKTPKRLKASSRSQPTTKSDTQAATVVRRAHRRPSAKFTSVSGVAPQIKEFAG
eukprot:scaffold55375_cov51-Phaeocystis_antarctica.AAC.1